MPELSQVIPAIAERLLVVHFPVTFTDLAEGEAPTPFRRQADRTLKRRLLSPEGLRGALRWLVDGAVRWYAEVCGAAGGSGGGGGGGLRRAAPEQVKEFSRQYLAEQDHLAAFLREQCEVGDDGGGRGAFRVSSATLLASYNEWLRDSDTRAVDARQLAASLRAKGFLKKTLWVDGGSKSAVVGLRLKERSSEDCQAGDAMDG